MGIANRIEGRPEAIQHLRFSYKKRKKKKEKEQKKKKKKKERKKKKKKKRIALTKWHIRCHLISFSQVKCTFLIHTFVSFNKPVFLTNVVLFLFPFFCFLVSLEKRVLFMSTTTFYLFIYLFIIIFFCVCENLENKYLS